jgi:hypothetical protein
MGAFAVFCSAFIESVLVKPGWQQEKILYTPAILPKKKGCRQPFLTPQKPVLN